MHPCPAHSPESIQTNYCQQTMVCRYNEPRSHSSIPSTPPFALQSGVSVCTKTISASGRHCTYMPTTYELFSYPSLLFLYRSMCRTNITNSQKQTSKKSKKANNKHIDNPNNHPKMLRKEEIKVPICTLLPCFELSLHSCDLNVESEKSH